MADLIQATTHRRTTCALLLTLAAASLAAGCGASEDEKRSAPPPVVPGTSEDTFSLENGTYFVADIRELSDGCGKEPLRSDRSLTQEPFTLENDGTGKINLDFCGGVKGAVFGNKGSLAASNPRREMGGTGRADQECRIDLTLTADNTFKAVFIENQRNRNAALRAATTDVAQCTTSFNFTMQRQ